MAVLQGNQMQHHVERGCPAGAGQAVAVDHEQAAIGLHFGECLAKRVQPLPMRGRAVSVQQSCPGQEEAAGVDGAEIDGAAVEAGQPLARGAVEIALRLEAGAHDSEREVELAVQAVIGQ